MGINRSNIPVVKYIERLSRDNLSDFYTWLYDKFQVEEDKGAAWKESCYDALVDGDYEKARLLQESRGKILLADEIVDTIIDRTTRSDVTTDMGVLVDILLKTGQYTSVTFDKDPDRVIFTTADDEKIKALKFSEVAGSLAGSLKFLEGENRHGQCHYGSIYLSKGLLDENSVATGYNYTFGEGSKFIHSWVEADMDDVPVVIDVTRNLLMRKNSYYYIRNVDGAVHRIPKNTIIKEENIFTYLGRKNPYLVKYYLANRPDALRVYDILKSEDSNNITHGSDGM